MTVPYQETFLFLTYLHGCHCCMKLLPHVTQRADQSEKRSFLSFVQSNQREGGFSVLYGSVSETHGQQNKKQRKEEGADSF